MVNQPASQPVTASIDGLTDCGRWAAREEIVRKHEARVESSQKVQDLLWVPLPPLPSPSQLTAHTTQPQTRDCPHHKQPSSKPPPPPQYMRAGHMN